MGRKAITTFGKDIAGPANDGGYRHKSPVFEQTG
jgi:hypothetical protein